MSASARASVGTPESWRRAVTGVFSGILDGTSAAASRAAEREARKDTAPALGLGFAAISAVHALQPQEAARLAGEALEAAGPRGRAEASADGDDEAAARAGAAVAAHFAAAGSPGPDEPAPGLDAAISAFAEARPETLLADFLRYQEAEAHLACGRVGRAVELVDAGGGRWDGGAPRA